jgi:hypothetical protein
MRLFQVVGFKIGTISGGVYSRMRLRVALFRIVSLPSNGAFNACVGLEIRFWLRAHPTPASP